MNGHTETAEEFIARKALAFKKQPLLSTKDISRTGHHVWCREAWTFMAQSNYPEKVFIIERLRRDTINWDHGISNLQAGEIEYRFGYYIVSKYGRTKGRWVWGQFCPLIPKEDLQHLLLKAEREGTIQICERPD